MAEKFNTYSTGCLGLSWTENALYIHVSFANPQCQMELTQNMHIEMGLGSLEVLAI